MVFNMLQEDPGKVDYSQIGGLGEQIRELRESIELPLMNPELFLRVGIKPPKGVLLYGPPGTGERRRPGSTRRRGGQGATGGGGGGARLAQLLGGLPACLLRLVRWPGRCTGTAARCHAPAAPGGARCWLLAAASIVTGGWLPPAQPTPGTHTYGPFAAAASPTSTPALAPACPQARRYWRAPLPATLTPTSSRCAAAPRRAPPCRRLPCTSPARGSGSRAPPLLPPPSCPPHPGAHQAAPRRRR
jgi:hypothetical protein